MMVVVTGGSSSGKSEFAERLLMEAGDVERIYMATMIPWDAECVERIARHREIRKEKRFRTIERPVDLCGDGVGEGSAVLLECMSNLLANELYRTDMEKPAEGAFERICAGLEELREKAETLVIVTNEVFSDGGPYAEETERYRELLGGLNVRLAAAAEQVYEVCCGCPRLLKGADGRLPALAPAQRPAPDQRLIPDKWTIPAPRENRSVHMILIVGGAFQGKRKLALRLFEERMAADAGACDPGWSKALESNIADGSRDPLEAALVRPVIFGFHEYIRRFCAEEDAGEQALAFVNRLVAENPDAVVVCDELGSGIVPADRQERLWRELTGDACQLLAERAGAVCRVVCGIPQYWKGEGK